MIVHLIDGTYELFRHRVKASPHAALGVEHERMFYVYLLHSAKDNGFYIGFSTNLERRLAEQMRGASFATKLRGPWQWEVRKPQITRISRMGTKEDNPVQLPIFVV